jgi:carbon storage regulator CsrA
MLVLSRNDEEEIIITIPPSKRERRIVVTTIKPYFGQVRLGFDAEKDVIIHRKEIQEKIEEKKKK